MRFVGLDVHKDFCEVAVVHGAACFSGPRVASTPKDLEVFAQSLGPNDQVVLEAGEECILTRQESTERGAVPFDLNQVHGALLVDLGLGKRVRGGGGIGRVDPIDEGLLVPKDQGCSVQHDRRTGIIPRGSGASFTLRTPVGRAPGRCAPGRSLQVSKGGERGLSVFTQSEIDYLGTQRLGRLATVGANGHPHVVPVGFRYNAELDSIDIGGHDFAKRKKFRDVGHNPWVALVVDDLASVRPWVVRGIEIRGKAEILQTGGEEIGPGYDQAMFRIRPSRIVAWGLEGGFSSRST